MVELHSSRLLAFARELQHVSSFGELVRAVAKEAEAALGFRHAWMFVADAEDSEQLRLLDASEAIHDAIWENAPRLPTKGDRMIEEIIDGDAPVVVVDARTDPRTDKEMVDRLGNRTIINVPLRLLDKPMGAMGMGTFGNEGVRLLAPEEIDYIVGMASQVVVAAARIRFLEERARADAERAELEHRIQQIHKLESLGLLAGGIAHDFNNLLTIILSTASLIDAAATDPQTRQDADVLVATAERGRALTRQLLAMSRSQALRREVIDLRARLQEFVKLLQRVIPENIEVDLACADALPTIEVDPSQIEQVLMNLCINARDAMPKGGRLSIKAEEAVINDSYVRTHPWAKKGQYALVTIVDTGTGMTREVRERIFEPFFTTKTEEHGTGLGLAVAYGIVSQHGGMMNCYSEPGVGTSFKVYLPLFGRTVTPTGQRARPVVTGGNEAVLVAEDDAAVRKIVGRVLGDAGYRVTVVENGEAACAMAKSAKFDVILLDVIMPKMSGPDALRAIRSEQPHARFILTSGYIGETSALAAVEEGLATILEKPYDPDGLLRTVQSVLVRGT